MSSSATTDTGVRVTATLTREQMRLLRGLAQKHKVSVAWLIRYAVDQLIERGEEVQVPFDFIRRS